MSPINGREVDLVVTTRTVTAVTSDSDADVIRGSWQEPQRFAMVFDRHYRHIYGYAARRLGRDRAEDVAAETFLIAFDHRRDYDPARADARPWLYGIASNLIARHARAEVRRYRALARAAGQDAWPDTVDSHADAVADRLDAAARRGRLAGALARLSGPDRDVLLLVAWAGLTGPEAATALGIPAGTARSRLHRARQEMRAALDADQREVTE